MLKEKILFTISLSCAVLAGFLLFFVRTVSAPLWAVLAVTVLMTGFLFFASGLIRNDGGRYQQNTPSAVPLQRLTAAAAALCLFAASLLRIPQFIRDGMVFSFLLVVAPLLAAIACILRLLVGELHPRSAPFAMIPVFFLCIQLMTFYRANSYHPSVRDFGFEIVVLALLVLGLFLTASSKYQTRTPHTQRFWSLLPLAGCMMELCMLFFAREQLYRAADMNAATLLGMAGASLLLLPPLLHPIQQVAMLKSNASEEAPDAQEASEFPTAPSDPDLSEEFPTEEVSRESDPE